MRNLGTPDRLARLIIGAVLIAAPFVTGWPLFANPLALWAAVLIGAVLVATSVFSFCPIYRLLGISTAPKRLS